MAQRRRHTARRKIQNTTRRTLAAMRRRGRRKRLTMRLRQQPPGSMMCGQAVVAMFAKATTRDVCGTIGHSGPTSWRDLHTLLHIYGVPCGADLLPVYSAPALPPLAVLRLPTGAVHGHWVAVADGVVYDPAMDDPYPAGLLDWSTYPARTIKYAEVLV